MKNIYLLPTTRPSKLYKQANELKLRFIADSPIDSDISINQHIYITSDEEIKEGDWCYQVELNDNKVDKCHDVTLYHTWTNNGVDKTRKFKKIILTTDQDLIKDGVQAIDDEFLEWFVKNPSCEYVEIKMQNYYASGALQPNLWEYKIIIPQEEPKLRHQQIIDIVGGEDRFRQIAGIKPKQETLEEAAEKYLQEWRLLNNIHLSNLIHAERCKNDFKAGAKWQQERMYSEEEVLDLLAGFIDSRGKDFVPFKDIQKWFEQFKKK